MATFDPFEQEFRRRANGLRRTPSAQSWNRLERRLDRRNSGPTIFGIRPWMIAALILLVAGTTIISHVSADRNNPLAKRAEFMEELSTPYVPEEVFTPQEYFNGIPAEILEQDAVAPDSNFREVPVAAKYRIHG